jgi:hypothetical protein
MTGFDVTTKDASSLLNRVLSNALNNTDEQTITIPKELFNGFYFKTNKPSSTTKVVDDKAKDKIQSKKPSKPPKCVQNALTKVKKSIITRSKLEKIQTKNGVGTRSSTKP